MGKLKNLVWVVLVIISLATIVYATTDIDDLLITTTGNVTADWGHFNFLNASGEYLYNVNATFTESDPLWSANLTEDGESWISTYNVTYHNYAENVSKNYTYLTFTTYDERWTATQNPFDQSLNISSNVIHASMNISDDNFTIYYADNGTHIRWRDGTYGAWVGFDLNATSNGLLPSKLIPYLISIDEDGDAGSGISFGEYVFLTGNNPSLTLKEGGVQRGALSGGSGQLWLESRSNLTIYAGGGENEFIEFGDNSGTSSDFYFRGLDFEQNATLSIINDGEHIHQRVGINTDYPRSALDVYGNISVFGNITADNYCNETGACYDISDLVGGGNGGESVWVNDTGTATYFGNVSIGGNLTIDGDYQVPDDGYAFQSSSSPKAGLYFNATSLLFEFINNVGNMIFGIGVTDGNIHTTGNITHESNSTWGIYNDGECIVIGNLNYVSEC